MGDVPVYHVYDPRAMALTDAGVRARSVCGAWETWPLWSGQPEPAGADCPDCLRILRARS